MKFIALLVILVQVFYLSKCQLLLPAQVWIPVYNSSNSFYPPNYNWSQIQHPQNTWNNTGNWNNSRNVSAPAGYPDLWNNGRNYSTPNRWNNNTNSSSDGHLIVGTIQWNDRLLFSQLDCQIHYVPAQILIPTYNGTHIATNHSIYRPGGQVAPQQVNYPSSHKNGDGHLFVGDIQMYDRLIFSQVFWKPKRWWTSREKIIEYPKDLPAGYTRHETINAIRVYNQFLDGNTARAEVLEGGIGRQYVKIKMSSKWGNGFRFLVQLFGH